MSDRYVAYTVILASDISEYDAEQTTNALRMVKGVAEVTPVIPDDDLAYAIADYKARREVREKVFEVLRKPTVPR